METSFASSPEVWNSELRQFISEDHRRLAEVLHDYKPTFSLVFIPQADRQVGEQFPFAILDSPLGKEPYIVRYLTDAQMRRPAEVLAWCFEGDIIRHRPMDVLARIEAKENAEKLLDLKRRDDELQDRIEFGAFMFSGGRDKLHTIKHDGKKFERS